MAREHGLRLQLDASYRSNDIGGISTLRNGGALEPLGQVHGREASEAGLADVIYDLPVPLPIQPYIGAGAGYSWVQFNNAGGAGFGTFRLPQNNRFTGPTDVRFGSGNAFAYQAIAGLSMPLIAGLDATLEYRFLGTARADVSVSRVSTSSDTVNGVHPSATVKNGFELHENAVLVGFRYVL